MLDSSLNATLNPSLYIVFHIFNKINNYFVGMMQGFFRHSKVYVIIGVILIAVVISLVNNPDQHQEHSNLPIRPQVFVGRQKHVDDVVMTTINGYSRIIVISGGPGVGKSTLAITVGYKLIEEGRDVFYVSFEGISTYTDALVRVFNKVYKKKRKRYIYSSPVSAENLLTGVALMLENAHDTTPGVADYHEQNLRDWAQNLQTETVVLLDNTDDITLQENENRINFINFLCGFVKESVGNSGQSKLSIIITSRFHIVTPDPPSHEVHLEILDQHDAEEYMNYFVPHLPRSKVIELVNVTGGVPLAILILGTLTRSLPIRDVDEIILEASSDPIDVYSPETFGEKQLSRCIHASLRYLNESEKYCFLSVAQFPGSFDRRASKHIIGNLTGDSKCVKKLIDRSLVELTDTERYLMHPFLRKYAQKMVLQGINTLDFKPFFKLFVNYYLSYISNHISITVANNPHPILGLEHHNVLFMLEQFMVFGLDIDVPLQILLPFAIQTFDIVHANFPKAIVVKWWDTVAKVGFASLSSLSSCTLAHEQLTHFILSVSELGVNISSNPSANDSESQQMELLLLGLDNLLGKAGNCSQESLLKFYRIMDLFYHVHNSDEKGLPYLLKFVKILIPENEKLEDSYNYCDEYTALMVVAAHLMALDNSEEALCYLKRAQTNCYSFDLAKMQVKAFVELSKFHEGMEIAYNAQIEFSTLVNSTTESLGEKGQICFQIAMMFHELADYESKGEWLLQASTYFSMAGSQFAIAHVNCLMEAISLYRFKGDISTAIEQSQMVLKLLAGISDLSNKDMLLCTIKYYQGHFYYSTNKYEQARVHYDEAFHLCTMAGMKSPFLLSISLKFVLIDIKDMKSASAHWKCTIHFVASMSTLWQQSSESVSDSKSKVSTILASVKNTDFNTNFVEGVFTLDMHSWTEMLSKMILSINVSRIWIQKVYYENQSLLQNILEQIQYFTFVIGINTIVAIIFGATLAILEAVCYHHSSSSVGPSSSLCNVLLRMLYFIMVRISWVFYIFLLHLPKNVMCWLTCDGVEYLPNSVYFQEYHLCLVVAHPLNYFKFIQQSNTQVSKFVPFSFYVILYIISAVIALSFSICTVWFIACLQYLFGIDIFILLYINIIFFIISIIKFTGYSLLSVALLMINGSCALIYFILLYMGTILNLFFY